MISKFILARPALHAPANTPYRALALADQLAPRLGEVLAHGAARALRYPLARTERNSKATAMMFPPLTPGVKKILIVLGLAFAAQLVFVAASGFEVAAYDRWVLRTLALDADELLRGRVWQVLTYMFLHSLDGWGHLLSNAIGFYFIGGALEQRIGTRALLRVSLGAGLAGAAAVLLVQFTGVVTGAWEPRPVLGASGAVSGLLGAFCFLFWDEWLLLFFIRLRGKHLFWLIVAVDAARGLSSIFGSGNVAVHCHFGGLLFGVAWVSGWWPPRNVGLRLKRAWLARKLRVIEGGRSTKEERTIH